MKKISSLKDIIQYEVKNSKVFRENILYSNWKEIAGEALSRKTYPMYIKNKKLTVVVENSSWLQQMNFIKKQLIENINDFLGGLLIEDIYFKIGKNLKVKLEKIEDDEINNIDISDIVLTGEDIYSIRESIKDIENIEIKEKMYKLIAKNRKREIFLLKEGYKKCNNCGSLFKSKEEICELCFIEMDNEIRIAMTKLFKKNPKISFMDSKYLLNRLTVRIYDEEKFKLSSKCIEKIKKEKDYNKKVDSAKIYILMNNNNVSNYDIDKNIELFLKSFT